MQIQAGYLARLGLRPRTCISPPRTCISPPEHPSVPWMLLTYFLHWESSCGAGCGGCSALRSLGERVPGSSPTYPDK